MTFRDAAFSGLRPRDPGLWAVALLLVAGVVASAWTLFSLPQEPIWDQQRLLSARFEAPYHPSPPAGFTSQLFVMGVRQLLPSGVPLNEGVRAAAMAFWMGSAALLALALLERRSLAALLLLLLFSSQFPFLWLSTELVVGGLLCLMLLAWVRRWPTAVLGALLALLALGKPELGLISVALVALAFRERRTQAPRIALAAAASLALLLAPGLWIFGPGYLVDFDGRAGGRAFASFSQHFAAMSAPFQLAPGPDPWASPGPYVERRFPGADSLWAALTMPGLPYLDFLALSLARALRRLAWTFHWGWLAVPVLVWARRRAGLGLAAGERALLWSAVGLLPLVLLAYPHVRYLARYAPVFWLALLVGAERLGRAEASPGRRGALVAVGGFVLLALVRSVDRASVGLALAPQLPRYWFPD